MDGSVASPQPYRALGLRLLAAASLATMAMLVKLAQERGAHLGELIFWRQVITLIGVTALMAVTGTLGQIRSDRIAAHGRRAVIGIIGMAFVYGAVILLPLAEATTLSFTTPLFAVLIALALFRERIGRYRWTAVLLGFAGVAIVMQPGTEGAVSLPGTIVGLIAGLMVAIISFLVQDLNKTEGPRGIVFWFCALTAPPLALALPLFGSNHDLLTWLVILSMGLAGTAGQLLLTSSLRYGSAATIIVMDYTALFWAVLYGWWVFDRLPTLSLWLGAPLIIAAGATIAWRERLITKRARAA